MPLNLTSSSWFDTNRIDISFRVGNRIRNHSFMARSFIWIARDDSFSLLLNCQDLPTRRSSVDALQRRVFSNISVGLSDYFDALDIYERFGEGTSKAASLGLIIRNALRLGTASGNQFFGFDPWAFDEATEQAPSLSRFAPQAWQREVLSPTLSPLRYQYQFNHFTHAISQIIALRRQRLISAGLHLLDDVFNSYQQHQASERVEIDRFLRFAWEDNLRFFRQASNPLLTAPPS